MVLKRVGVASSAKMNGALCALLGLLFGAITALFAMIGGAAGAMGGENSAGMMGAIFGIGAVIFFPIIYGVFGVVFGAIYAWLYNMIAGMVGGIELDLH